MAERIHSTRDDSGDWSLKYNGDGKSMSIERIAVAILADVRREVRKQTSVLERIDERLKRNGMSLAKRNRK